MIKSPYYELSLSKSTHLISSKRIRFVQRDLRLQKHHKIFVQISKNAKVCSQKKRQTNFLKVLDEVIPLDYFGTRHHQKLFYNTVKLILTQSMFECIYVQELTMGYDFKAIPWLVSIANQNSSYYKKLCKQYLRDAQLWLLEKIVKPLIRRFYVTVKVGREIELVPKPLWSSFRQKVLNTLQAKNYIIPVSEKQEPRGFLQITPKDGYNNPNKFRLIINLTKRASTCKKDKENAKTIGRIIRQAASSICSTKSTCLYQCWKEYQLQLNQKRNFGVKIDVEDAFGSININFMCYILSTLQKKRKISTDVQAILVYHIQNQYVVCGKNKDGTQKIWKWNHGLCQGDRFSSALCQLYLSYLDSVYLHGLIQSETFLHRTVDDYFFCSTNENDVFEFIKIMHSLHSVNDKTQSNVTGFNHQTINYFGRTFFIETGQVKGFYSFKKRTEIRQRFKLWNIKKSIYNKQRCLAVEKFLETAMNYSLNNFRFQNMELNTIFNTEERVLENYFEAMVFLGFKMDAAVMALKNIIKDFLAVAKIIQKLVFKYAHKAFYKVNKNKGMLSRERLALVHFLKLGLVAFILVFRKREYYAKNLILEFLEKCESKFSRKAFGWIGFWRFEKMPEVFEQISIQRRLPYHKKWV